MIYYVQPSKYLFSSHHLKKFFFIILLYKHLMLNKYLEKKLCSKIATSSELSTVTFVYSTKWITENNMIYSYYESI